MKYADYMRRPVRLRARWRYYRQHKKVRLWWNAWLAVQHMHLWPPETSLGFRIEWLRPLFCVFGLGGVTICLGRHPVVSDPRFMRRYSARGFLYCELPQDQAVL
jgi:hypothetical protein